VESKKLIEHLTTEKDKTNESVTQVENMSQTQEIERAAEEQCLEGGQ